MGDGTELWHEQYSDSHWIFAGNMDFGLNEGDVITIFSQYGEIIDVKLARNKEDGKSRGFAFVAYQDQRSTVLAVDNLNGSEILERKLKVDHSNYKGEHVKEGDEKEQRNAEIERLKHVLPEELKPDEIKALSKTEKVDNKLIEMEQQLESCDPQDPMCIILRERIALRKKKVKEKNKEKDEKKETKRAEKTNHKEEIRAAKRAKKEARDN